MTTVVVTFAVVYGSTVAGFLALLVDNARRQATERARLLSAVMARTPADFAVLTATKARPADDVDEAEPKPLVGTE